MTLRVRRDVAVEASEGLRDVLDGGHGERVHRGECKECLTEVTHDVRVGVALLHLVLDGVQHGGEGPEALKMEAVEPLFQRLDPRDGLLVVLHGDVQHAPLLRRWVLP